MSTVRETGVSLWTFYSLGASPSFANRKCTYKSGVCVVQYYEKVVTSLVRVTAIKEDDYNCEGMSVMRRTQSHLCISLPTLRRSFRTPILVVVASAAFICDCRNMRVRRLPCRLELPQLTKASNECLQEITLERRSFNGGRYT